MPLTDPRIPTEARDPLEMIHSVGGDALIAQLLRTFLDFAGQQLALAAAAAARDDRTTVSKIAHAIKSSASQVGAAALSAACADAERAAGGADAASASLLTARMTDEFTRARAWMEPIARAV